MKIYHFQNYGKLSVCQFDIESGIGYMFVIDNETGNMISFFEQYGFIS